MHATTPVWLALSNAAYVVRDELPLTMHTSEKIQRRVGICAGQTNLYRPKCKQAVAVLRRVCAQKKISGLDGTSAKKMPGVISDCVSSAVSLSVRLTTDTSSKPKRAECLAMLGENCRGFHETFCR